TFTPVAKITTKEMTKVAADAAQTLQDEQVRIVAAETTRRAMLTHLRTAALLTVGQQVLAAYHALKHAEGALDFDDIIHATVRLLSADIHAWVRYRLDAHIHHILLDEGQDTSADQAAALAPFVAEILSGQGQAETIRSMFAVGDMKQSIYRFRGAEPDTFRAYKNVLTPLHMEESYRSAPAILQVVDQLFANATMQTKLTGDPEIVHHNVPTARAHLFGKVTLWPLTLRQENETDDDDEQRAQPWQLPTYNPAVASAVSRTFARVAATIQALVQQATPLRAGKTPHVADYGDVLILLRSRAHVGALRHVLQQAGIPAMIDSGESPQEHPVVQDLLALGEALSNPANHTALAHVLKSPWLNWTDAQLVSLATRAGKTPWWPLVVAEVPELAAWQSLATTPYHLYQTALKHTGARARFAGQLGGASAVAQAAVYGLMDAFMDALHSQQHAGLDAALHTLRTQGFTVPKMENSAQGAVRVMTIHGAKGLEAPIVFMPDTTTAYDSNLGKEKLLWRADKALVLATQTAADAPPLQTAWRKEEGERLEQDHLRLLYVALTRAAEYLYIGGWQQDKNKGFDKSWYAQLSAIATPANGWVETPEGLVFSQNVPDETLVPSSVIASAARQSDPLEIGGMSVQSAEPAPAKAGGKPRNDCDTYFALPPWWRQPPAQATLPTAQVFTATARERLEEGSARREKADAGTLLHTMLAALPPLTAEFIRQCQSASDQGAPNTEKYRQIPLKSRNVTPENDAMYTALNVKISYIYQTYAWMFGANSQAEVPLRSRSFFGVVDRLVVDAEVVHIVDFKTCSVVPNAAPEKYQFQLTKYADIISKKYPKHQIKKVILWVEDGGKTQLVDVP
ncbi:MAG: UvrD-helicase domain-containing protein, partial [Alphaproteobacteria bacterium]